MGKSATPIELKQECVEARKSGMLTRRVYDEYYKQKVDNPMSFASFRHALPKWCRKLYPDSLTLDAGTYDGFIAHDATVQVSNTGEIIQAWIKQKATDIDPERFLAVIKEAVEPYRHTPSKNQDATRMLEIPLFDMHWGVAFMDYYEPVLNDILEIINSHNWDKIVIPFGQDFFHNDSISLGVTSKGTLIERVDMERAIKEGQRFMYALIETAIAEANEVKVLYTPGNHDRSVSWMFTQVLLERYGSKIVDDTLEYRKCITYGKNSIMITHGESKNASQKNLAHIFPIMFPEEFANANVREIHAGHLHRELDADVYGVMVRRISSGNKIDEWSNREDYVGTHRRFALFDWSPDKLRSIYYV